MGNRKLIGILLLVMVLLVSCAFTFDIDNGDRVAVFDNILIPEGNIVSGDAVAVFGNIDIRGSVRGDVVAVFGNVKLYGEAGGDIVTVFGDVTVAEKAVAGGDVVGVFGKVIRENGSVIQGDVVDAKAGYIPEHFNKIPNMGMGSIFGMLISFGISSLVVAIMPDRVRLMVKSCEQNIGRNLGLGILIMLVILLLIPVLILTIIGIIPAVLLVIALVLVSLVSTTAVNIAIGQKIAAAVTGNNAVYIHLLIGLVVVNAMQMVPIVGFLISIAVFFVALGIAFDTRIGSPTPHKKIL